MSSLRLDLVLTLLRVTSDGLMFYGALLGAYLLRMQFYTFELNGQTFDLFPAPNTLLPFDAFQSFSLKFTVVVLVIFAIKGRYRLESDEKFFEEVSQVFWALCAAMALVLVYFFFAQFDFFSRLIFGVTWTLALTSILSGRVLIRLLRRTCFRLGLGRQKVLLLGTGKLGHRIAENIAHNAQYHAVGFLSENPTSRAIIPGLKKFGTFGQLSSALENTTVDEVWLVTDKVSQQINRDLIATAHTHHKRFRFVPDELSLDLASVKISMVSNYPMITTNHHRIEGWSSLLKIVVDYLLAIIAVLVLSPIISVVALLIWFQEPGKPIFYASQRVGRKGKNFWCYKFRTMVVDAEKLKTKLKDKNQRFGDVLFKLDNDPRITPLGQILRQYSLDELPQLFNVLKLDMSLIGPRPHLPEEVKKYPKEDIQILSVRPGITGFAQVNGRSSLSFEEEMQYERYYLNNWSLWLDIRIFLRTIMVVLRAENAS